MTTVDWVIVAFCVLLGFYGYLQGFIVGILSLVGFGIGAFIGTRLGPLLLSGGSHSQYAPLFGLLGRCWRAASSRAGWRVSESVSAARCGSRGCGPSMACSERC